MDNQPYTKNEPAGIPPDAVKTGTISLGDVSPGQASLTSKTVGFLGYLASWSAYDLAQGAASKFFKENTEAYKVLKTDGFLTALKKGFQQATDLKLWKSTSAGVAALVGGMLLTDLAVKKIKQHNYIKEHGNLPRMDQVQQILKGEFEPQIQSEKQSTHWQDKTAKAEEPQQHSL